MNFFYRFHYLRKNTNFIDAFSIVKLIFFDLHLADYRFRRDSLFLVPMHGGIWTLCIDLPPPELQELRRHPKFPPSAPTCLNYLAGSSENARGEEQRNDWQHSK